MLQLAHLRKNETKNANFSDLIIGFKEAHSSKSSDLVAEALGGNDGDFLSDLLVSLEIQGHSRVVPLDHHTRRLLHCLCPDTPLKKEANSK